MYYIYYTFVEPVINAEQEAPRAGGNQTRAQNVFPADLQFLLSAFRGASNVCPTYI